VQVRIKVIELRLQLSIQKLASFWSFLLRARQKAARDIVCRQVLLASFIHHARAILLKRS
jgi:hypothetical protein